MASGAPDWLKRVIVNVLVGGQTVNVETGVGVIEGNDIAYEDSSFVTGESPRVLDVHTDLGRLGIDGYIVNDGDGDLQFEISKDGTNYGGAHTLKKDDVVNLRHRQIWKLRLTWVADCGYRVLVV